MGKEPLPVNDRCTGSGAALDEIIPSGMGRRETIYTRKQRINHILDRISASEDTHHVLLGKRIRCRPLFPTQNRSLAFRRGQIREIPPVGMTGQKGIGIEGGSGKPPGEELSVRRGSRPVHQLMNAEGTGVNLIRSQVMGKVVCYRVVFVRAVLRARKTRTR